MKRFTGIMVMMVGLSTLFSFMPATTTAPAWEIDVVHSAVAFKINHFFTPVNGNFEKFDGVVEFDPEDLASSKVDVTIDVTSVNTDNERRDEHLMSGDFFNAEQWNKISFVSDKITKSENGFVAHGKLTIRDVTKEVALPFEVLGVQDHPWREGYLVAGIRAQTTLNRTDYGVGVGDWAATAVVGDEVEVDITLEVHTQK